MEEKRVFERIEAPMKVRYEVVEEPPQSKTAKAKDIGGGGIGLALDERLDVGANLKLEIGLPGENSRSATVYGKVVWTRKVEIVSGDKSNNYYETGIQFTKADPLTIGRIFKYFQNKSEYFTR